MMLKHSEGYEELQPWSTENQKTSGSLIFVYFLTCLAAIGGLLFGYDIGIVSGSMLFLEDVFDLDTKWKELLVGATPGAAALFALIAGVLNDVVGRKKVIMLASLIFTLGAFIMATSTVKEVLLAGRVVVGIGIGFALMSVPVYVAEAAPAEIRGRLVTINQLFVSIGILISSIVAGLFSQTKENGWRYMLGLGAVPSVLQFVGFIKLPESPRWLMEKGRVEDARRALMQIRQVDDVEDEINEIQEALDNNLKMQRGGGSGVVQRMLRTQPVRRALILGCGLQMFQQLCGINTVTYYSGSILKLAGFPVEAAIWLVCVPNVVNCLFSLFGIWLVEKSGRKRLTVMSMIGVMIGLAVLAISFQLSIKLTPKLDIKEFGSNMTLNGNESKCFSYNLCDECITNEDCGYCYEKENPQTTGSCLPVFKEKPERYAYYPNVTFRCNEDTTWKIQRGDRKYYWTDSYCPTSYSWMAILGLGLFVMGFAPGLGPMPWTINSEIYPTWARSTGTSFATATNWVFNLIVSLTFLSLLESIGKYGTFWLYFGVCFIGLLFVLYMLPETKGKSLEEVQELFMSDEYKKLQATKE